MDSDRCALGVADCLRKHKYHHLISIQTSTSLDKYPAKQHARQVAAILAVDDGQIYLPGAPVWLYEDSDQPRPFRQRRYFFYLSGVNEPDCHVVYNIKRDELTLFLPVYSDKHIIYNGQGLTKEEAFDRYDVDSVRYANELDFVMESPGKEEPEMLYILHPDQCPVGVSPTSASVDVAKLRPAMDRSRIIKDDHEIKLIRKANEISADAHRRVLANITRLQNEAQVVGLFLDSSVVAGAKQSYEIIAASGINASTLHYVKNNDRFGDSWLMCLDAGAEWNCYASDVTRTFPLSLSWPSYEAERIYNLVDQMQSACIKRIKPGVLFRNLNILAHWILIKGLLDLGILHHGTATEILQAGTSTAFLPHGLGHHLGLEVHDVDTGLLNLSCSPPTSEHSHALSETDLALLDEQSLDRVSVQLGSMAQGWGTLCHSRYGLEEGMVVTVEPGIYFSEFALKKSFLVSPIHSKFINPCVLERYMPVGGVRIEDDILVTSNGYENLTTAPKGGEALDIIRLGKEDAENSSTLPKLCSAAPNMGRTTDRAAGRTESCNDIIIFPEIGLGLDGGSTDPLPKVPAGESLYQAMQRTVAGNLPPQHAGVGMQMATACELHPTSRPQDSQTESVKCVCAVRRPYSTLDQGRRLMTKDDRLSVLAKPTSSRDPRSSWTLAAPKMLSRPKDPLTIQSLQDEFETVACENCSTLESATLHHAADCSKQKQRSRNSKARRALQFPESLTWPRPDPRQKTHSWPSWGPSSTEEKAFDPIRVNLSKQYSMPLQRNSELGYNLDTANSPPKLDRVEIAKRWNGESISTGLGSLHRSQSLRHLPKSIAPVWKTASTGENRHRGCPTLAKTYSPGLSDEISSPHQPSFASIDLDAVFVAGTKAVQRRSSPSAASRHSMHDGGPTIYCPAVPAATPRIPAKPPAYRYIAGQGLDADIDKASRCCASSIGSPKLADITRTLYHGSMSSTRSKVEYPLSSLPGERVTRQFSRPDPKSARNPWGSGSNHGIAKAVKPAKDDHEAARIRLIAALTTELTVHPRNRFLLATEDPIGRILDNQPCWHGLCTALKERGMVIEDEIKLRTKVMHSLRNSEGEVSPWASFQQL